MTKLQFGLTQQNIISIHTSAREVTVISFCISQSTFISIHTSAREVTLISFRIPSAFGFQSTLPQGKWRVWCGIPSAGSGISIHTSAREVTVSRKCGIAININFNPHFRKGSDCIMYRWILTTKISIHTSAREVTFIPCDPFTICNISIHTSAREVTPCDDLSESGSVRFQSTLPQGKWREEIPEKQLIRNHFNPHFRKGSDCPRSCSWCSGNISIHTSAREVTSAVLLSGRHIHISIHTSAREVTALHPILSRQYGNFNPHFRKGSDSSRQS